MVKHYIIMSSSYTDGIRIALDITEGRLLNSEAIKKIIHSIKEVCGKDVPLSTHLIETESDSWSSVESYDPFFEGIEHTKSVEEFSGKIQKDRVLSSLDVANYILSKIRCTHLSLEKLVYFSYADYLCSYSKRLFEDRIYAFTYGPVIGRIYETYKQSGYNFVMPSHPDRDLEESKLEADVKEMPAKSRILFALDGAEKLKSIDQTIEKYGKYSARDLVSLTHKVGSPWYRVDSEKPYTRIPDDIIKEYHCVESVS